MVWCPLGETENPIVCSPSAQSDHMWCILVSPYVTRVERRLEAKSQERQLNGDISKLEQRKLRRGGIIEVFKHVKTVTYKRLGLD